MSEEKNVNEGAFPNFSGMLHPPPSDAPNFLDHYFANVYNKLEADALLYNRELPHSGLVNSGDILLIVVLN